MVHQEGLGANETQQGMGIFANLHIFFEGKVPTKEKNRSFFILPPWRLRRAAYYELSALSRANHGRENVIRV